jgi:2,3-bisphosphoglycerate-independent phosphoglycerate mutase
MNDSPKTLLVFVDGLGLGSEDPTINPIHSGCCPVLERLLRDESVPVDAQLGVHGLPQSATGQATLLTGCNAAERMGRHVEGLPGPQLKELVRAKNVFSRLIERGYSCAFANAFFTDNMNEVRLRRRQSVTTVASMQAFGAVRDTAAMLRNRAVYQDLTRQFLRSHGYTGPDVTPGESGRHLLAIAEEHDFTLFEYFQTDLMAHKGTPEDIRRVLSQLNEFLEVLLAWPEKPGRLLVLTSDHGNVEDSRTKRHTDNPVPLTAVGEGAGLLKEKVKRLTDFVPAILEIYPHRKLES